MDKSERVAYLVKQLEGVEKICEAIMKQALVCGAKKTVTANESATRFAVGSRTDSRLNCQSGSKEGKMDAREPRPAIDVIDLTSEDSCGEDGDMEADQAGATELDPKTLVSAPSLSGGKNAQEKPREEVMVLSDDNEDEVEDAMLAPILAAPLDWIGDSPGNSSTPGEDPISHVWSYMDKEFKRRGLSQSIDLTPQNRSDAGAYFIRKNGTETCGDASDFSSFRCSDFRESVVIPLTRAEPTVKRSRGRPRKGSTPNGGTEEGLQHIGNRGVPSDSPAEPSFATKRKGHLQEHDEVVSGDADILKVNSARRKSKIPRKEGTKGGKMTKTRNGTDDDDDEDEEEPKQPLKAEEQDILKECLSRLRQDEQVPYVAHRRNAIEPDKVDDDDSDGELGSLFRDLDLANCRFQELGRTEEQDDPCEHKNWDFDESMGYYCEDCGCVNLDIPSIQKKQVKETCQHPNIFFDDETGYYCHNCGKTRDIEKMLLIEDSGRKARKHVNRGQQYDSAGGGELQQVRLQLRSGSNDLNYTGESMHMHPSLEEKLHDHQKAGFRFLTENLLGGENKSLGCVIAHAPGTGKTCLIISFIQSYLAMFEKGRPLILAPKIMLHSWKKEFEVWQYQNVTIHEISTDAMLGRENGDARSDDEEEEEYSNKISTQAKMSLKLTRAKTLSKWQGERSVLLMSYNLYMILVGNGTKEDVDPDSLDARMSRVLKSVPNLVIMDEGHLARNKKTNISDALLAMETKRRVLLSGTLFQNNFKELFTLLKLCRNDFMIDHPAYGKKILEQAGGQAGISKKSEKERMLIESKMFSEEIGDRLEAYVKSGTIEPDEVGEIVTKLQSMTAPFVDWYPGEILKSLPGLEEYAVSLNLTKAQLRTLERLHTLGNDYRNNHMYRQKKLQSACVHPSLARKNDGDILDHPTENSDPHDGVKVTFILDMIAWCQRKKEKILIFCTTLAPFDYFEKVLSDKFGWEKEKEILRLDGKMHESERQVVIKKFNESDYYHRLLLASTKACKEGISLVGASRVVILDNPDNPSVVRQAVSRAFRIGQTRKVYVYRLVAHNKDEEDTFLKSVNKERLSQVLSDPRNCLATREEFLQEETQETIEDGMLQHMMLGSHKQMFSAVHRYNASG